jgi:hypothetical protein
MQKEGIKKIIPFIRAPRKFRNKCSQRLKIYTEN